ncbi:hypothetical protein EC957_001239 [Mortierella hygrophila]|uniref:Uncharacterized protein n=1 Tax=Mortierella hygrophila TaxID=979708 RepID=A0A9P6F5X0_9FUNG|nr:hypothetical protein EC957_001239 [Mortierella hygrophila]
MTEPKPATSDAANVNSKHSNLHPAAAAASTRTTLKSEHWKPGIQLGFDTFVLDFLEDESLMRVWSWRLYKPGSETGEHYYLGTIVIDTQTYSDIP